MPGTIDWLLAGAKGPQNTTGDQSSSQKFSTTLHIASERLYATVCGETCYSNMCLLMENIIPLQVSKKIQTKEGIVQ